MNRSDIRLSDNQSGVNIRHDLGTGTPLLSLVAITGTTFPSLEIDQSIPSLEIEQSTSWRLPDAVEMLGREAHMAGERTRVTFP